MSSEQPKRIHQGRNVRRYRLLLQLKQESLVERLGKNWHLRKLSTVENSETIEPEMLEELARALGVPVQLLETTNDENVMVSIQNFTDFKDDAQVSGAQGTSQTAELNHNYHDASKEIQELKQNLEKAMEEKDKLYRELLAEKDSKIKLLEEMLKKK
jgi:transcriptional regulator with XRE-family HTH domain